MTVYELKIDWALGYEKGNTTEFYSTEEKARKAFYSEIVQVMKDCSAFDKQTGALIDNGWELEKSGDVWRLFEKGHCPRSYYTITITPKNVN